jgi:hypothetical protein
LFAAIGFSLEMVMIDVLHCMDLGCTQDMFGTIFWQALPWVCKGSARKDKVSDLWQRIQQFYTVQAVDNFAGAHLRDDQAEREGSEIAGQGCGDSACGPLWGVASNGDA